MHSKFRSMWLRIAIVAAAALSILAIGAVSATGAEASTWRVGGAEFFGEETFTLNSTTLNLVPANKSSPSISCGAEGTGRIFESSKGSAKITLGKCVVASHPECYFNAGKSLVLNTSFELVEKSGLVYGAFRPQSGGVFAEPPITGAGCPYTTTTYRLQDGKEIGGFAAAFETEAVSLKTPLSEAASKAVGTELLYYGAGAYTVEDVGLTAALSGAHKGSEWGVSKTTSPPPPRKQWRIKGVDFTGEETFTMSGSILIHSPSGVGFGGDISCSLTGNGKISKNSQGTASFVAEKCALPKAPECSVNRNGSPGQILFQATTELLTVKGAGGEKLIQVYKPIQGTVFTPVFVEGNNCVFEGEWRLRGTFAGQPGSTESVAYPFSFSQALAGEAGTLLQFYGNSQAYIEGNITETLSGSHAGQTWGAR